MVKNISFVPGMLAARMTRTNAMARTLAGATAQQVVNAKKVLVQELKEEFIADHVHHHVRDRKK